MKKEHLVIGIGELLWDVFPGHRKIGGAPANFAYHAAQLGADSLVVSAIGRDELGKELVKTLENAGVEYDIQENGHPTGTVQVTLDGRGIPKYEICEPVAWDFIETNPGWRFIAHRVSAVCFGSLAQRGKVSGETIRRFVGMVRQDAYKVFDINLRQHYYSKGLIWESLRLCNVLKINDEELEAVAGMFGMTGNRDETCSTLIDEYGLQLLALTCGTEGSYLYTTDQKSFRETPRVKVADTVGAGDSFTAAIVAGLLAGKPLEETHELAVKLSAFVCTQEGAMPGYLQAHNLSSPLFNCQ